MDCFWKEAGSLFLAPNLNSEYLNCRCIRGILYNVQCTLYTHSKGACQVHASRNDLTCPKIARHQTFSLGLSLSLWLLIQTDSLLAIGPDNCLRPFSNTQVDLAISGRKISKLLSDWPCVAIICSNFWTSKVCGNLLGGCLTHEACPVSGPPEIERDDWHCRRCVCVCRRMRPTCYILFGSYYLVHTT